MHSKTDNKEFSVSSSTSSTLLAWSSRSYNEIIVIDLETNQNYVTFDGVSINDKSRSWTHVKEIPNSKLLVSLHHNSVKWANMEIFDISKKGKANKIYSLGEVSGVVGNGDVTYNSRRSILGAIPVREKIAYHLFTIDTSASNAGGIVKLNRKTKWHSQYSTEEGNQITSFDFNPVGESIATVDRYGVCLISDVNTNNYVFHLQVGSEMGWLSRCRWSTDTGEPSLFFNYNKNELNILDVQKKALTLKNPVQLDPEEDGWLCCIDVCQSNANLLASSGEGKSIKIFDRRESKIVKTFKGIHSSKELGYILAFICYLEWISCVRWNPSGDMIASASDDMTAKLLDFKTGKVLYTGSTSYESEPMSICFI